jgi:hypothetical protein
VTALVLRTTSAAILWMCCTLWISPVPTAQSVRLAFDVGRLLEHGPAHWFAACDWGTTSRLIDPARKHRQRHRNDCGPASLRYVLSLRGAAHRAASIERHHNGYTFAELQRVAADAGESTRLIRFEDLRHVCLPAILHLRRRHFVVLLELHPNRARLFDPAHGVLLLPPRNIACRASGAALEFVTRTGDASLRERP